MNQFKTKGPMQLGMFPYVLIRWPIIVNYLQKLDKNQPWLIGEGDGLASSEPGFISRWYPHKVAVWCSGNALVLINAVALHRARLVLGWVTAFG